VENRGEGVKVSASENRAAKPTTLAPISRATSGGPQEAMAGVRRFQTVLAAEDRLYVAGDGRVYAFGF